MLISFSGLDCAGKTTQIELLSTYYQERGFRVVKKWSRIGYTPVLEHLKNFFRTKKDIEESSKPREIGLNEKTRGGKLLLYLSIIDITFYYGLYFRLISSKKDTILICDRYLWDSYIDLLLKYRDIAFHNTLFWKSLVLFATKPNCSFVLTITPEESMRRSELKVEPFPESKERREMRLLLYQEMINQGKWQYEIDCMRPVEAIQEELRRIIDENL